MIRTRERRIARIRKNNLSSLVVRIKTYQGRRCIDLRVHDDPSNERAFSATHVGIAIRPDMLRAVIEALEAAEAAALDEGLIKSVDVVGSS